MSKTSSLEKAIADHDYWLKVLQNFGEFYVANTKQGVKKKLKIMLSK